MSDEGLHGTGVELTRLRRDLDEALGLLRRCVKYATEDRAQTPGVTRLARVVDEARAFAARHPRGAPAAVPVDPAGECVKCIKCRQCCGACDCTGGPQTEPECTCYESFAGHQPGCYFNRLAAKDVSRG